MKNFSHQLVVPAAVGFGLVATACFGGNLELVERKTAELRSINEQVAKQAAPGGLKEGDTVEVKATLRVDRTAEKTPVVRDVKVERVTVSTEPVAVAAKPAVPSAGSSKIREPGPEEKQPAASTPGFRQECLDVPAVKNTPPEIKVKPMDEEKVVPPPVVAEEPPPGAAMPGFRQERLNVPSVNEKRKE